MIKPEKKFSILIATKNRRDDLIFTLHKISNLLRRSDVECIICDDGSSDGTFEYVSENHPGILLIKHQTSKGLMVSRNELLHQASGEYAISIDDDLHFITEQPLEIIENYFKTHPQTDLLSFRIFWGLSAPASTYTDEMPQRVRSFAGGAHVLRISSWRKIPDYPVWFVFYGEEDFISYQMLRRNMEIHYLPQVLTHHRVDLKGRKNNNDYYIRQRRALRSDWYLYFLFVPLKYIPKKMTYSIWTQFTKRVVEKRNPNAIKPIAMALFDLVAAIPKIIKYKNRLSQQQYASYKQLESAKLYWKPENEKQSGIIADQYDKAAVL
ncbi:hypothetical protein FNO01nite_11450 [Flavobacterium noncentrifugens]|uniref:Glycosyltransferase involved in cell wall bisynthesis n=1 Tax=Flavobacterium noncentrifugens TaxID=1128970 RepID=A0A1G8VES5_9FLAO|nr:glycosyltransferase family A protein [Flavobacterium noncentrifugens]GEP50473.1 hypothetical protein FNO01nite_11450 [Flavobacterium noncentrifugens]SDJ64538.1 Glycosyltransferase involved in cell wall bisynthesis [Flavobacterium noncentrifugens]